MPDEQPVPVVPDLKDLTKPCPLCCEPINPKARVCKHCKGDLSWRRHVGISATTLAMLTALVAVIGNVIPIAEKVSKPDDASISAGLIGVEKNVLDTLVTNHGVTKAVVVRAHLSVRSSYYREILASSNDIAAELRIVDEGKTARIRFEMTDREPPIRTAEEQKIWNEVGDSWDLRGFTDFSRCELSVEYVTGRGMQTVSRQKIDCSGLANDLVLDLATRMLYFERLHREAAAKRVDAERTSNVQGASPAK